MNCHIFGCFRFISTKTQLFFYLYFVMISAASFQFQYIWLWHPLFVVCLKIQKNFQPITELLYKIAQSRNLAFPAQSADSHTRLDWQWLPNRSPEGVVSGKISVHVNKNMSGAEVKPRNFKFWSQRVFFLWVYNAISQKCDIVHLLFNKDFNGKH